MEPDEQHRLLDGFAPYWERIGAFMHRRPTFILAIIVSCVIVTLAAITVATTAKEVDTVTSAFCNGQKKKFDQQQMRNCRALLDQLLKDPSPEQRERIKQIAREP